MRTRMRHGDRGMDTVRNRACRSSGRIGPHMDRETGASAANGNGNGTATPTRCRAALADGGRASRPGCGPALAGDASLRPARRRGRRAVAAIPPPTSTSATRTTSASRCRGLWLLASLYFRGEVRGLGNIPEEGGVLLVGNHSGGNLTPDTGVFTLAFCSYFGVERALLPARPQPRAVHAGAVASCASTGRSPPRTRTPARRSHPAPRCSSTRAATTRSTARSGSATASTSTAARASSGSRSTRTCRSSRSSPSAGRRRRSSSRAARASRSCCASTRRSA